MLLRRWGQRSKCLAGRSLAVKTEQAAESAPSICMIAFPSLLETFTDPLSRHPEPSDVRRLSEALGHRDRSWLRWPSSSGVRGGVREQENSNMFRLRWLQVGGATRGMPRRDRAHRKPWPALGLVACLALLQSGCQSGPFSNCGAAVVAACSARAASSAACRLASSTGSNGAIAVQPGVVTEGPVEYAAPATVVTPGATS